jgi:hypothetical protein
MQAEITGAGMVALGIVSLLGAVNTRILWQNTILEWTCFILFHAIGLGSLVLGISSFFLI